MTPSPTHPHLTVQHYIPAARSCPVCLYKKSVFHCMRMCIRPRKTLASRQCSGFSACGRGLEEEEVERELSGLLCDDTNHFGGSWVVFVNTH